VQLASQGTKLHISQVELNHSGLFSCQATNEAGTAGAEVEVSVHGKQASVVLEQSEMMGLAELEAMADLGMTWDV